MNRKPSCVYWVALLLATFIPSAVSAHAADERAPRKGATVTAAPRSVASSPGVLSAAESDTYLRNAKVPHDVLVVRCMLNRYALCRGIPIALYDSSTGARVAGSITSAEGIVGFEGLPSGGRFEAKIESIKYKGRAQATPGTVTAIEGNFPVEEEN